MGVSTDGEISFGLVFEEGYEFPWEHVAFENDIEGWWLIESGWRWEREQPFDEAGNYAPGFSRDSPEVESYFVSRSAWIKAHPCPVAVVNYQSDSCPAFILAVPSSRVRATRGNPEKFDPSDLYVTTEDRKALAAFVNRYNLEPEGEAGWFLTLLGLTEDETAS